MSEKKPIPFVLLDESVTTYGFRVLVDGVDISQFEKNPVMFYDHRDWNQPIGMWADTKKADKKITAETAFDYDDDDRDVQRVIGKVERGVIKMASVGLTDLVVSDDPIYKTEGQEGPTIIKCRLREASITPIGANHNAIRLYDNQGQEIELTDKESLSVKLSDFIANSKIENTMSKNYLSLLNLGDKATDEQIETAVKALLTDKATAETNAAALQGKLDAIEAEKKAAQKKEAETMVDAALKDGRLEEREDGSVRKNWLQLFDVNFDMAKTNLESIPKRQNIKDTLNDGTKGDDGKPKKGAWAEFQDKVENKNA